jgi:hypothetical protein
VDQVVSPLSIVLRVSILTVMVISVRQRDYETKRRTSRFHLNTPQSIIFRRHELSRTTVVGTTSCPKSLSILRHLYVDAVSISSGELSFNLKSTGLPRVQPTSVRRECEMTKLVRMTSQDVTRRRLSRHGQTGQDETSTAEIDPGYRDVSETRDCWRFLYK